MANNIFQQQVTPVKPKVLAGERIYVYVPRATNEDAGIASFNSEDFIVNNSKVSVIWPYAHLNPENTNGYGLMKIAENSEGGLKYNDDGLLEVDTDSEKIQGVIDQKVAAEASIRAAADDALSARILAEASTRATADTNLNNRITQVDNSAVHKTGDENISGTKNFEHILINGKEIGDSAKVYIAKGHKVNSDIILDSSQSELVDAVIDEKEVFLIISSQYEKGYFQLTNYINYVNLKELHFTSVYSDYGHIDNKNLITFDVDFTLKTVTNGKIGVRPMESSINKKSQILDSTIEYPNSKAVIDYVAQKLLDYYTKQQTYTQEEIDAKIQEINSIQIRNVNAEAITATEQTVQSVATQYIVDNYERQPKTFDGLIITLTDKENDKVLFMYSETSGIWINVGVNGVDLSNYYTKQETQDYVGEEDVKFIGREQLLGFTVNAIENDIATAVLDSSLSDYALTNSTGYLFDVVVPTNLTSQITKNTKLLLKDKDNNSININCVFEDDKDNTVTFGMLEQITTSSNAGLELEFYGHYSQFTEGEVEHRVVYTDTVVKGVELVKLEFDGMDIKLDGEVLNFVKIKEIMTDKLKFATIYYEDFACIYYPMADGNGDAIFFQSVYTLSGKNYVGRIIINSDNDIQTTDIEVLNASDIVANNGQETTATLSTLKINNTNYDIGIEIKEVLE